jgi:hypothetical protein
MRLFENWWDYVPRLARCIVAMSLTLGLPFMQPMGHFWD